MTDQIHRILTRVQKPARYVGGEYNQIVKRKQDIDVRVAFCFPDTYEIGMSNIGMRILYGVMNEMPGVWCERVFAPWGDMEAQMRAHRLPLWALESHDPVRDFDLVAFTLGYEMCYSNVLNMLELSGLPLLAKDRKGLEGIVFAGGVCTVNPEPLADFIDFFSIGEGEESTREIIECYRAAKRQGLSKQEFLREAAKLEGVYVPSLYTHTYNDDGTLAAITPAPGAPARVKKRIVQDLDRAYFPTKTIVPSTAAAASVRRASATGRSAPNPRIPCADRRSNRSRIPATARSPSPASRPPTTASLRRWPTVCSATASRARSTSRCPVSARTISRASSCCASRRCARAA